MSDRNAGGGFNPYLDSSKFETPEAIPKTGSNSINREDLLEPSASVWFAARTAESGKEQYMDSVKLQGLIGLNLDKVSDSVSGSELFVLLFTTRITLEPPIFHRGVNPLCHGVVQELL